MGRITVRRPVTRIRVGVDDGADVVRTHSDMLTVEEPLEIRVGGTALAVTMRTPGRDVELAAGFLVSEGVISRGGQFASAMHCADTGADATESLAGGGSGPARRDGDPTAAAGNTYNVLDVTLAPGMDLPTFGLERNFYTTSSCGVCGKASIDAVETVSHHEVADDALTLSAAMLAGLPDALRAEQAVFDKTGGLHAAALFDAESGHLLVLREDVGRHNAVDKVIGWAVLHDALPLRGTVLQVSGRASFELVQKAVMAGIPVLSAVSAPSSLSVELAADAGLTLVGFVRGNSMNVYSRPERIVARASAPTDAP